MKYLFFDIDGTLVSHDHGLIASAKEAIEKSRQKGNLCFLATGRHLSSLFAVDGLEMDGVIYCNGAGIFMHDKILYTNPIPHAICSKTVFQAEERNGAYSLQSSYEMFKNVAEMERFEKSAAYDPRFTSFADKVQKFGAKPFTEYRNQEILKIDIGFATEEIMDDFLKVMSPELTLVSTAGYHIEEGKKSGEITRKGVSKGTAIEKLVEMLHGDMQDTYAFGDSGNDTDMIRRCHTGIAMGNGFDELKKEADYVTDDIDHDGLAKAMEHFDLV
ncbi:MAG: Cof-type HAD-IIB family hydrolase [Lactimicrobium sp.]|uniref:Cof-type HAD-IIB family hydrolase n=1 Tax=Lactimicrobium sp. TaxID=2563780 RepID=UPI002F354933